MAFNYQRGDFCPVTVQPAGAVPITLNIKGYTLDFECLIFDVTSTGSGGVRARINGLLDVKGTINADVDLDLLPFGVPQIVPGVKGICLFFLSPVKAIQIPTIISKVHYESNVESEVKYSFDVQVNSLAGFIVYPAF